MKLSISTLGCPDWDFMKILKEFKEIGVEGIEVRGLDGEMEAHKIKWFTDEYAAKTKELLKEYGLKFSGFGSSVSFHSEKDFNNNLESGKKAIDVCKKMDIPAIRIFGDQIPDKSKQDETIARITNGLKQLCEYAADENVLVNMETHGDFNTAEVMRPIVDALKGYNNFGILWDIGHSDKTYRENYKVFYEAIKPCVKHLHVKDHIKTEKGFDLCATGKGDIPIKEIVNLLIADGFDGYFSLEWEKKWVPSLADPEEEFPNYAAFMKSCVK